MTELMSQRSAKHPLRDMAAADTRGQVTPEEAAHLRQPETVEAWYDALVELKREIDAQFADRNADAQVRQNECFAKGYSGKQEWFEYKGELDLWKAKANRMKRSVENSIREAKNLKVLTRRTAAATRAPEEREEYRITMHRVRAFLLSDGNITPGGREQRTYLVEELETRLWSES